MSDALSEVLEARLGPTSAAARCAPCCASPC